MRKSMVSWVQKCLVCQQHKSLIVSLAGLLQPIVLPIMFWEKLRMDFIERLPCSHGMDTILAVVDYLGKYVHFIPPKYPFVACVVA